MKIFIVFLGLLLVNLSIISFKGDFESYVYLHRMIDNIAFECAEMAASGDEDACEYSDGLLEYSIRNLEGVKISGYSCDVYFEGDYAVAFISMDVDGLFRFPPVTAAKITAEKRCEMKTAYN